MSARLVCALLVLSGIVLPIGASVPAAAQSPAQSYLFGPQQFRNMCRPPLKYAAGTCVRRCPSGYRDMGGYCQMKTSDW